MINEAQFATEGAMPDAFTTPPSAALRQALTELLASGAVPAGFTGRLGLLLVEDAAGTRQVRFALEAKSGMADGFASNWSAVRAEQLWPQMDESEVPDATLIDGRGERFTLVDFLSQLFADYPEKPWNQGGEALARRKARWRAAIVKSLASPSVALINAFNQSTDTRALAMGEVWLGASPQHEIRFSGTFYPPASAGKLLLARLTNGLPLAVAQPHTAPDATPALPVLFEDDAMVVVNKPSRLASVPGIREVVSAKSILEATRGPLRVVHRLDMDTSGVLIFAKNPRTEKRLQQAFRDGVALKRYVARLAGELTTPIDRVSLPLALNLSDRPRQCVLAESEGGKASVTQVERLGVVVSPTGVRKTLVALYPESGRTHQLRIHCAHQTGLGVAIDGDPFYGPLGLLGELPETRLCLHAESITIPHPETGTPMTFSCEADFPAF